MRSWRSSLTVAVPWVLTLVGYGLLVAGVTAQFGAAAALMVAGTLALWAGLRSARGVS